MGLEGVEARNILSLAHVRDPRGKAWHGDPETQQPPFLVLLCQNR